MILISSLLASNAYGVTKLQITLDWYIIDQSSCELVTVLTQHALDSTWSAEYFEPVKLSNYMPFVLALQIIAVFVEVKLPITNYCV